MKKLLFPISERDYETTQGRVRHLIQSLSKTFQVEVITHSKEVDDDLNRKCDSTPNVTLRFVEPKFLPLNFGYRDNLAKIFVQYTDDFFLPNTDFKIWKAAAFDDFWGHISNCAFPEIQGIDADLVMLPLMSHDDAPWEETDIFYTTLLFMAKEAGAKVVGYQLYPVFNGVKLMPKLMDAVIVRKAFERDFHIKMGVAPEKIHLLTEEKEIYSLSTIEDTYKNHMYTSQIEIGREELGIVVCNHGKLRPQIIEIFKAIEEVKIPTVLFLIKRDFVIRELNEDEIIKDLFFDPIKRIGCRFYLVDQASLVPIAMTADLVISPSYVVPLEFAARYDIGAWVYNRCYDPQPDVNGVKFMNRLEDLKGALKKAYEAKRKKVGVADVLNHLTRKFHEVEK
ncbi:MAG: hypothetical protein WAO55_11420 [Candidatus Manganitrophaceae bacterium]